jgi:hypothetical protein
LIAATPNDVMTEAFVESASVAFGLSWAGTNTAIWNRGVAVLAGFNHAVAADGAAVIIGGRIAAGRAAAIRGHAAFGDGRVDAMHGAAAADERIGSAVIAVVA